MVPDGSARVAHTATGAPDMCGAVTRRRRGRPVVLSREQRIERILDSLEMLIVDHGLGAVTMDAVSTASGMSKRTVYEVFGNRDALFGALVRRTRENYVRPLTQAERALPWDARLRRLFSVPGDPGKLVRQSTAFLALIAGAATDPDLGRTVLREGLNAARDIVHDEILFAQQAGEITVADARLAAMVLLDMVYESPYDRMADPDGFEPSARDMEARIEMAIGIFAHGVAASKDQPAE